MVKCRIGPSRSDTLLGEFRGGKREARRKNEEKGKRKGAISISANFRSSLTIRAALVSCNNKTVGIHGCKRAGITGAGNFTALKVLFSTVLFHPFACLVYVSLLFPGPALLSVPLSLSLSSPSAPALFLRFVFTRFVLMTKIARETRGAYYLTGRLKK